MTVFTPLYHLAIAGWAGGVALFTFVLTPALFRTQPRDLAGKIVGVLFPGYFRWGLVCGSVALLSLLVQNRQLLPELVILLLMLAATLFQALFIEPRAVALKQQIASFETTPKEDPARRAFARLHGISALCNLGVCVGGVALVVLQ